VTILYLADIRFPLERANGIQSMETCYALAQRGHAVTLIVRPDSQTPARDPFAFYGLQRLDRLRIEAAPIAGPPLARRAGYAAFVLGRALGRARQDAILTRDLGLAALLLRVPRTLRAPLLYEAHGIAADVAGAMPALLSGGRPASPSKIRRLRAREEYVWRQADAYVTITHALQRELKRRFGARPRTAVVPDGVRVGAEHADGTAAEYAEHAEEERPFVIGYAGHLYPWKGVDLIVEAVAAIPDAQALIIGGHPQEPDLERVKALANQLDCSSRIEFTGLVPPAKVGQQLRRADVLVLPNPSSAISDLFTSPLKLFEYMASGLPIVASDLSSIREILADERNALLAQPGNPESFVTAIRRLKTDRALGKRLADQALVDVRAYTWERRAEKLEALLRDMLQPT
jgi:glycosyltransferase involved in cell wall biosynthesis